MKVRLNHGFFMGKLLNEILGTKLKEEVERMRKENEDLVMEKGKLSESIQGMGLRD